MSNISRHPLWRRLTGCIAIYALLLQGAFVGLASHPTAAAPAFEICQHVADEAAVPPGEMPSDHHGTSHCPLCVAGEPGFVCPARVSVPTLVISDPGIVWAPVRDPSVRSSFRHSDHQSRAPPVNA